MISYAEFKRNKEELGDTSVQSVYDEWYKHTSMTLDILDQLLDDFSIVSGNFFFLCTGQQSDLYAIVLLCPADHFQSQGINI